MSSPAPGAKPGEAPLLEVRGLVAAVPEAGGARRVLLEVPALDVWPAETVAVIGPNGSGKSTLFASLACLRPWAAGTLLFEGRAVEAPGPRALDYRRRLAVVMQDPLLLDQTVLDNAAQGLRYRGLRARDARSLASGWLERLGVGHLAGRRARQLSGGEAQRVSLARAMALEPTLLLLDEPFAPLDAPSRATFIEDLRRLLAETGTTTLLVTHDRSEALVLADRVAVLLDGRLAQIGTPRAVFEQPVSAAVAAFVGVETIEPGMVESSEDGVAVVRLGSEAGPRVEVTSRLAAGQAVLVCVRPEDVAVSLPEGVDGAAATSVRNRLPGRVRSLLALEGQFRVMLDCGIPLVALVTKGARDELGLEPGREVVAAFKATAAHLLPRSAPRTGALARTRLG